MRLESVRKRYGRRPDVLADIDLDLTPGRPVVVRGANGSGKSTLLRIAAGAAAPSAGSVEGRPRIVGYLPDRFPAQLRMTAAVYLRHLAAIHGAPAADAARDAAELLAALGFSAGAATPMSQLSKGNAQKVGLAQALACGAGLVVLDEPWSGLDADASAVLRERLDAASAAGVLLLLADHSAHGMRLLGARVLRLDAGALHPDEAAVHAAADEVTLVELTGHGEPDAALRGLPGLAEVRILPVVRTGSGRADPGTQWRARLRVASGQGDALLAAALGRGCSVLGVRRELATDSDVADVGGAGRPGHGIGRHAGRSASELG